ncbi:MAG: futalosine hydrolase [Chitinophagaceae bacterium]|jgi:futalosine hydrolase
MKVLISAATSMELTAVKNSESLPSSLSLYYTTTGVGVISTVYHLMEMLSKEKFDFMIQVGIAGSFDQQLPLGNAVNIEKESIAEMGVVENNEYKDIFKLGLADANVAPYSDGLLLNPHKHLLTASGLTNVTGVTNNEITTDPIKIERYKHTYNATIESMEGAAFHYIGIMKSIPFIQIRGISNFVGERNKKNWKIDEAILAYTKACNSLLQQL